MKRILAIIAAPLLLILGIGLMVSSASAQTSAPLEKGYHIVPAVTMAEFVKDVTRAPQSGSGEQFCSYNGSAYDCPNAWNGGPWVYVYTHPGVSNNDFTFYRTPTDYYEMEFTGGGGWTGNCIGDAYNNSGYADTSLDECPTSGTPGWGTEMEWYNGTPYGCVSGTIVIFDEHWQDYLHASEAQNGAKYYLNVYNPECFYVLPAA